MQHPSGLQMRHPSGLQISDLEPIQSDFEQEVTIEEAKKVVGGCDDDDGKHQHPRRMFQQDKLFESF